MYSACLFYHHQTTLTSGAFFPACNHVIEISISFPLRNFKELMSKTTYIENSVRAFLKVVISLPSNNSHSRSNFLPLRLRIPDWYSPLSNLSPRYVLSSIQSHHRDINQIPAMNPQKNYSKDNTVGGFWSSFLRGYSIATTK